MRFFYIVLAALAVPAAAQRHDNTWLLGYSGGNAPQFGHSILTFPDGALKID